MFRFLILSLLFTLIARAEGDILKASLRFQIWVPQQERGIMIEGDSTVRREPIREEFFLKQGESFLPFRCGELRRSAAVSYTGIPRLELYRETGDDAHPVVKFELTGAGAHRVVLMKVEGGYKAFPVPSDSESLPAGNVQMVNATKRAVIVQQHGGRAMILRKGATKVMSLAEPKEPTVHLTVRARREEKWELEYSRPYTFLKNARSVCLFYETQSSRRVQMKLFSGL